MFTTGSNKRTIFAVAVAMLALLLMCGMLGVILREGSTMPDSYDADGGIPRRKPSDNPANQVLSQSYYGIIDEVSVHIIDVGQADCIFIDAGPFDILIDAGNNDDGDYIVDYLRALDTDDIEIMVATHPHMDHIGGLDTVLDAFNVKVVIDSGHQSPYKAYKDYMDAVKRNGAIFLTDDNMEFDIAPGIRFSIIETGDNYSDMNNNSVVSLLEFNDIRFLFTGDMGKTAELRNLNSFPAVDVLKVGHHGSRTSSCPRFLDRISPKVAIISCGICNECGHYHGDTEKTLDELYKRNIQVYRTSISGHIIITTDGETYTVQIMPKN